MRMKKSMSTKERMAFAMQQADPGTRLTWVC